MEKPSQSQKKIKLTNRGITEMKKLKNIYIKDISKYLVIGGGTTYFLGYIIGDPILKKGNFYFPGIIKFRPGFCFLLLSAFLFRGKFICDKNFRNAKFKIFDDKNNFEEF